MPMCRPAEADDDWTVVGGLPRPTEDAAAEKAPDKDKAGFCTAII